MPAPVTVLRTGTGWTVDVTSLQLSSDVGYKDIYVTVGGVANLLSNYTKTSASLLTYTGLALPTSSVVQVLRDSTRLVEDFMFSDVNTSVGLNNRFTSVERVMEDLRIFFSVVGTLTASVNLTSTSTGVTAATADNSTLVATTAYVKNNLVTYATIASLSAYATNASLANYATLASLASYLTTSGAASTYATIAALAGYAPLSSPSLTGTPTAPTATALTSTTQLATTAYSLDAAAIKQGTVATVFAVPNIDWVIPAGVRRVTMLYSGNSFTDGTRVRLGDSGGVVSTGYVGQLTYIGSFSGSRDYGFRSTVTDGIRIAETEAATDAGCVVMNRLGNTNTWILTGTSLLTATLGTYNTTAAGRVVLTGTLTTVRLIPPSSNFVAGGTVQVVWEY